jgi:transposase
VFERDHPLGETISRTYDIIDDARVALFREVRDERIKRILEDPSFYRYTYFSPEEEAEGKALQEERDKRWIINHLKNNTIDREEYFKKHPEHEEEYMKEINEAE